LQFAARKEEDSWPFLSLFFSMKIAENHFCLHGSDLNPDHCLSLLQNFALAKKEACSGYMLTQVEEAGKYNA